MPPNEWEAMAAELALAFAYEEERRVALRLHADLGMVQLTLEAFGAGEIGSAALQRLAEHSTVTETGFAQPLAEFSLIGRIVEGAEGSSETYRVEFHWKSGNPMWIRAVQSEPFSRMWHKTVETKRMNGMKPEVPWSRHEVARVVAIPLEAGGELMGIWIAGLSPSAGSLAALERLELRGLLASRALTDIKRAEQNARREECHRALMNASREALVLLDARGQIAAISHGARELLGEKQPNVEALTAQGDVSTLFRHPDQDRVRTWIQQSSASQTLPPAPPSLVAKLGSGVPVRVSAEQQRQNEFMALRLETIAPAKETEESLRAETELQVVLGWVEEGVVIFDAQEDIRAMNSRFAQIVRLSAREMAELTTLDALIARISRQAADPVQFARKWRQITRGNIGGVREELEIAVPSPCILERASHPILDAAGHWVGRVEIYRDLTARRLFQAKLLQTERLAGMGQMVSGVAHELSNPLTTILGYAQRMLMREESSGNAGEARQIFHEAERAVKILRQLMLSSREAKLERARVSLNRLVLRTMEMQRLSEDSETIRTELDLDPLLPGVWGDAGQLQQVLVNLVSNARQAIEESGKNGVIRVRTKYLSGNLVLLEVGDDGPGIPEAIAARIFDPFFTTKEPGLGTGLGLSIVLGIVREHGAHMNVISPPEGGTKFLIEWRAMPATPPAAEQLPVTSSWESAPFLEKHRVQAGIPLGNEQGVRAHVLVVEDEPTVARLIADVLEDAGHDVDVMLNGREALERAAGATYDLAICDMKMPGLDGQHFFKALVRAENPLREKLLFVTGDVVATRTREFLERNQLPHVAKPFRVEELNEAVRKLLLAKTELPATKATAITKQAAKNG
ncbi:MAG: hypothetical protein NVS9B13_19730 [Candidatus Acidiferrum sp.]